MEAVMSDSSYYYSNTGRTLENFVETIPGSIRTPYDVLPKVDSTGDLKKIKGIDVIVTSVRNLLLTSKGSYVFDPEFGVGIHRYIFELFDDRTKDNITNDINVAIRRYERRAKITTNVRKMKGGKKGFKVDLDIKYEGENRSISINYDESLLKDG